MIIMKSSKFCETLTIHIARWNWSSKKFYKFAITSVFWDIMKNPKVCVLSLHLLLLTWCEIRRGENKNLIS